MAMKYIFQNHTKDEITLPNIFSMIKSNGEIHIKEDSDQFFTERYTIEQAIEMLEEVIAWVKL